MRRNAIASGHQARADRGDAATRAAVPRWRSNNGAMLESVMLAHARGPCGCGSRKRALAPARCACRIKASLASRRIPCRQKTREPRPDSPKRDWARHTFGIWRRSGSYPASRRRSFARAPLVRDAPPDRAFPVLTFAALCPSAHGVIQQVTGFGNEPRPLSTILGEPPLCDCFASSLPHRSSPVKAASARCVPSTLRRIPRQLRRVSCRFLPYSAARRRDHRMNNVGPGR
jgi:hypothetical protein